MKIASINQFVLLTMCSLLMTVAQNSGKPFPQYASDHPLYATAVGSGNPSLKSQFDAAQYIMDQYEFPNRVSSRCRL